MPPNTKKESKKLKDYISGVLVSATPEEIDTVQPFSQKLVEDYAIQNHK